jgi:putative Holliday junction resolvase
MRILGIDFGLKKIGLAISEEKLSEPFRVIRYEDIDTLMTQLKEIIRDEDIEKVVVGISEGEMAEKSREFGKKVQEFIDVDYQDETLTSQDAQKMAIESGMSQSKRHEMEDAYAASIMLQSYLDISNYDM